MNFATTKGRIIQYLDFKEISKSKFFQDTGIKRGFLDSDKLKSSVSDGNITNIIAYYKDLSLRWLLTGEGEMLVKEKEEDHAGLQYVREPDISYKRKRLMESQSHMDSINLRLNQVADHYGLKSYSDFARKTGIGHQSASNYLKGKQKPDAVKLTLIIQSFEKINARWLLTGKGQMLLDQKTEEEKNTNEELLSLQRFKIKALEKDLANVKSDLEQCKEKLFFKGKSVERYT